MANVIGVSALNRYVKTLLERDPVLAGVALRGEISNFTHHFKTGHYYFSLKDEKCAVKAVMFRSDAQRVPFVPENGMRVIVRCRVSLFERDGAGVRAGHVPGRRGRDAAGVRPAEGAP